MERVIIGGGQREYWIDVCKGMGIILVLLAHAIKKECILWIAINQFHMPLFFVISGYLYTGRDKIFTFVYKKLKGLYIPYLISSLIMYAIFVRIGQEPFSVTELVKILIVRRHILGGANRTLISALSPLRLCRIGTCRRLSAE